MWTDPVKVSPKAQLESNLFKIFIPKVNKHMQFLNIIQSLGATQREMVHVWIIYCRSVLEQSTQEQSNSREQRWPRENSEINLQIIPEDK